MKNRLLLLVTGALLASHRPALAQAPQSPTEGMYVQLGWTVGQVNYTTPYRGEPASQFAVGQPFMRYTSYGKKSLVLADVSGIPPSSGAATENWSVPVPVARSAE